MNEEISYIENSLQHLEENTATNTNQTLENYVKPKYQCYESVTVGTLWVFRIVFSQSIGILLVGIFGLFGNFMTILVLRRIDTNVMFNRLLLTLGESLECLGMHVQIIYHFSYLWVKGVWVFLLQHEMNIESMAADFF